MQQDLSMSMTGPVVEDLKAHFVQRWNFIYREKYDTSGSKYKPLSLTYDDIPDRYYDEEGKATGAGVTEEFHDTFHHVGSYFHRDRSRREDRRDQRNGMKVQLVRSCTEWSNGCPTEVNSPFKIF